MSEFTQLRDHFLKDPEVAEGYREQQSALKIGRLFHHARKRAKLTQEEAAERAKIDQAEISRIETGEYRKGPTVETLARLARAVGVTLVVELVAGTEWEVDDLDSPDEENQRLQAKL